MACDIAEQGRTQYAKAIAARMAAHKPAISAVILAGDNARWMITSLKSMLDFYSSYYKPSSEADWGQFDGIVFPQTGNHEYSTGADVQGYFDYFATRTAVIKQMPGYDGFVDSKAKGGYYSFDFNGWHIVSLNSNCSNMGGCNAGSAQETWLKQDLAKHASMPIIGAWHAPRYTCGGSHGDATEMQALWADLYDAGADFVFNGHNHYYERWKPLNKDNPNAAIDTAAGITQVIAGSYGVSTYTVCSTQDPRVAQMRGGEPGMGAFYLTLGSDGTYSFQYELESDGTIFDSGSGKSHHAK
jgi:hypothetical protein